MSAAMHAGAQDFLRPILDGGWVMLPLFALGLLIYGLGFRMLLTLLPLRARKVTDEQARQWVARPETARRRVADILRYATAGATSRQEIRARFEEIRRVEIPRINISISTLNVLVAAAPLLGLLGTVLGMLTTFHGLSLGGTERTTTMVAEGIRVALITTEMGLFIAIPGTFLVYLVRQLRHSFVRLLVRIENAAVESLDDATRS